MTHNHVFITATGTELGKTLTTCGLLHQLQAAGKKAQAVKPVISGFDENNWTASDTGLLLEAMGLPLTMDQASAISPWRYEEPVSPHLAAEDGGPDAADIVNFCQQTLEREGIQLIEGAGGIMTPLVQGFTQLDLLERLHIPAVLVTGSYLGTISHTLTALEAIKSRGLRVLSVLVSETFAGGGSSLEDTAQAIRSHAPLTVPVYTLPRQPTQTKLWQHLPPLLELIDHD